jgi:hypothetical protein
VKSDSTTSTAIKTVMIVTASMTIDANWQWRQPMPENYFGLSGVSEKPWSKTTYAVTRSPVSTLA